MVCVESDYNLVVCTATRIIPHCIYRESSPTKIREIVSY
jgi:hypothetical protein